MKIISAFPRVRPSCPAWVLFLAVSLAGAFSAAASVWTNDINGNASGQWTDSLNWSGGIPDRSATIADFSQLDLSGDSTISLASPETVGELLFANTTGTNGATLAVDGPNGDRLSLNNAKGAPIIVVSNVQAFLGGIAGADGFILSGNGALAIYGSTYGNNVTGPIYVEGGLLGMVTGESFAGITGDIMVAPGAAFQADDDFDGTVLGNNFFLSGPGGNPSGYASSPTVPDGTIYWSEPLPMGALDIGYNAILSGTITLSGDTTISHGYNGATINGPIMVTNAGQNLVLAVTTSNQSPLAVNGAISLGNGSLTVSGIPNAASVTLSGSNIYTGGTFITGGTLQMGPSCPFALDGVGGLTITSDGTLDLFGNNMTFAFLSGGSGIITDTSIIGSGTNTLLTITQTNATFFGGAINDGPANPVALLLDGNGSLTLGGTNDYSGPTTVLSGKLLGGSGGNCTNSAVEVANGATNGFQAIIASAQWACLSLTYDPGTNFLLFNFGDLPVNPTSPVPIAVANNLTINGVLDVLVTNGIWLATGEYPLLSYQSLTGVLPTNLLALPAGVTATLTNDAAHNLLALNVTKIPAVVVSTPTNGVWTNNIGGNISGFWGVASNWSNHVIAGGTGGTADFGQLNITVNSIISNDAPRTIGTLLLANPATNGVTVTIDGGLSNHLTLASSTSSPVISVSNLQGFVGGLSGAQGFIMQGNGALAIYGNQDANSLKGPIVVKSGLLATVDGAGFLGVTGAITVNSGASFSANGGLDNSTLLNNFNLSGAGVTPSGWVGNSSSPDGVYMTEPSFGALDLLGDIVLAGAITINSNAVITHGYDYAVITGPIAAAGPGQNLQLVTTVDSQPDLSISGNINLGSGTLSVNGMGAQGVTLGGANAFAAAVLNSGMLHLDNVNALGNTNLTVNGGVLDLNTQNITFSSLAGASSAVITDNGSSPTPTALTVNYNPNPCTPLQPGNDSLSFVQPTSTAFLGAIDNGPSDAVSLTLNGCGALILGGTNTYSGPTTVNSGELIGLAPGSCSNTVVTVFNNAGNGIQLGAAGSQWACAGLAYQPGNENLNFNFNGIAPSKTTAPLLVNGDLTFNGNVAVTITIDNFNSWATGAYPLIAYTGTLLNLPVSVAFQEAVPQTGALSAALQTNASQGIIYLNVVNTNTTPPPITNAPALTAVYTSSNGNVSLQFPSSTGGSYVLESATNLNHGTVWTPVSTNTGTGGTVTLNLSVNRSVPQQYFRLEISGGATNQPPPDLSSKITAVYQSGSLDLQTSTVAGHNYILESTPGLGGTNVWTPVSTNAGTGGTITVTNTVNRTEFFRFLVQ